MTRTDTDSDSPEALLLDALDGAETDPLRLRLLTALCLLNLDQNRVAELERLRRDGIPVVLKL